MTSEPIPVLNNLSDLEKKVVQAARLGHPVKCSDLNVDELAKSNDPRHVVRAELIRELLVGRRGDLDPAGVWITGSRVTGELDLTQVTAVTGLGLISCAVDDRISVDEAKLPFLELTGSKLPRLTAFGVHVESSLALTATRIQSTAKGGAVRLVDARVDHQVDLSDATITNDRGPAVNAAGIHIGSLLIVRNTTVHCAAGDNGAVQLTGARVGGQVNFQGCSITNTSGPAVEASGLRATNTLFLDNATLSSNEMHEALSLDGACADQGLVMYGRLICPDTSVPGRCGLPGRIAVDGFVFTSLNNIHWKEWLHLIRYHTDGYRPQPYQQLAAVERASGHDHNARHILIAQQQDLRRRNPEGIGGRAAQWTHAIWGAVGGYGYRAARLALALFVALALSGTLGWVAGQVTTRPGHQAAERVTTLTAPAGTPCSLVELVGLGIDRGLPLGTTGLRTRCDLDTATRWGQGFTIIIWCIQIAVWALATLAIASYTGLIRKPA